MPIIQRYAHLSSNKHGGEIHAWIGLQKVFWHHVLAVVHNGLTSIARLSCVHLPAIRAGQTAGNALGANSIFICQDAVPCYVMPLCHAALC